MQSKVNQETIKKVMTELGRRGGKKTSKAKKDATKKSLAKARAARWPTKAAPKTKKNGSGNFRSRRSSKSPAVG